MLTSEGVSPSVLKGAKRRADKRRPERPKRAEMLLVAEAVASCRELCRTPSVRHQWYWGPFVAPPEANRLRLPCGGFGLGDADELLIGDALAEGSSGGALLGAGVLGAGVLAATLPLVP